MLLEKTREYIRGLSDEALADYVRQGTVMYDPEAVDFARQVLLQRGADPTRLADLDRQATAVAEQRAAAETRQAHRSHDWVMRALYIAFGPFLLLSCVGIILLLFIWWRYHERGERRKAREMWALVLIGLGALFTLVAILALIQWATGNP